MRRAWLKQGAAAAAGDGSGINGGGRGPLRGEEGVGAITGRAHSHRRHHRSLQTAVSTSSPSAALPASHSSVLPASHSSALHTNERCPYEASPLPVTRDGIALEPHMVGGRLISLCWVGVWDPSQHTPNTLPTHSQHTVNTLPGLGGL